MPQTEGVPGFDEESLQRFKKILEEMGPDVGGKLMGMLRVLELRFNPLRKGLLAKEWRQLLEKELNNFLHSSPLNRYLFRAATAPLKIAHYEREELYRAIGAHYRRYPVPKQRYIRPNGVISTEEFPELDGLELDAVVVGTGAGGAVVGYNLAKAGYTVLLVEEGEYYHRLSFGGRAIGASLNLYRNRGAIVTLGLPPIYLPVGRSVGGTTSINSGTCYRPPSRVFKYWREKLGLSEWGEREFQPFIEEVEKVLEVEPADPKYLGGVAKIIAKGCEELGYTKHGPLPRNAPECDGRGICPFLCPTDAKRSTNVSYIPLALRFGAYLSPNTSFIGAEWEGQKIKKIKLKHLKIDKEISLHPKKLIISAGSLKTPLLLKRLGIKNRWLGKNLSIHPAASVVAQFREKIEGDNAIPQGYGIEEFHEQGLLFEGAFVPPEMFAGAAPALLWGQKLQKIMGADS